MNASTGAKKAAQLSLAQIVHGLLRHYLGGRRGRVILGSAAVATGLYLSWGWVTALGIAPLLLALAPCAAMCALGLCMNRGGGKSCSTEPKPGDQTTMGAANQDE